jgi:hypothetical protein
VKEVFEHRIREGLPLRAERILGRVRQTRGGELYDSRFGIRGRGEGLYAEQIQTLFEQTVRRLKLGEACGGTEPNTFQRPVVRKGSAQLGLFS